MLDSEDITNVPISDIIIDGSVNIQMNIIEEYKLDSLYNHHLKAEGLPLKPFYSFNDVRNTMRKVKRTLIKYFDKTLN